MKQIILISLLAQSFLFAQIPEFLKNEDPLNFDHHKFRNHTHGLGCADNLDQKYLQYSLQNNFLPFESKSYDITYIDLYLNWSEVLRSANEQWNGVTNIKFYLTDKEAEFLEIDAVGLFLDKAILNGNDITDEVEVSSDAYKINNDQFMNEFNNELIIEYTKDSSYKQDGFYFFRKGEFLPGPNEDIHHNIAYTQSQPNYARTWMPCNDNPYEKQNFTISIEVPNKDNSGNLYTTASNGQIISSEDVFLEVGEQTLHNRVDTWQHQFPISSYLTVANVSVFNRWEEKVARIDNPLDSVLLSYYVWEEDMRGHKNQNENYDVKENTFHIIPEMLDSMTSLFGTYPFKKFGTVSVAGFPAGGMEHQSIQTIRRSWLNGSPAGISHELAHMWIGDLVTCRSWNDIWLNEGGAVFGTMMYMEKVWDDPWKNSQKINSKFFYLYSNSLNFAPVYTDEYNRVFQSNRIPIIYDKAGWVYLMLRNHIGEEKFFEILNKYFEKYAYSFASTEDFKKILKDNSEFDVDKFFDQWVFSSGHPVYNFTASTFPSENGFKAELNLEQIQSNLSNRNDCPEVFDVPQKVILEFGEYQDTIQIQNNEKNQNFEFFSDDRILDISLDENFTLFQVLEASFTSVENNKNKTIDVFPNLLGKSEILNIRSVELFNKITIHDALGQQVKEIQFSKSNQARFSPNLGNGKYFLRIYTDSNVITKAIIIN